MIPLVKFVKSVKVNTGLAMILVENIFMPAGQYFHARVPTGTLKVKQGL